MRIGIDRCFTPGPKRETTYCGALAENGTTIVSSVAAAGLRASHSAISDVATVVTSGENARQDSRGLVCKCSASSGLSTGGIENRRAIDLSAYVTRWRLSAMRFGRAHTNAWTCRSPRKDIPLSVSSVTDSKRASAWKKLGGIATTSQNCRLRRARLDSFWRSCGWTRRRMSLIGT